LPIGKLFYFRYISIMEMRPPIEITDHHIDVSIDFLYKKIDYTSIFELSQYVLYSSVPNDAEKLKGELIKFRIIEVHSIYAGLVKINEKGIEIYNKGSWIKYKAQQQIELENQKIKDEKTKTDLEISKRQLRKLKNEWWKNPIAFIISALAGAAITLATQITTKKLEPSNQPIEQNNHEQNNRINHPKTKTSTSDTSNLSTHK